MAKTNTQKLNEIFREVKSGVSHERLLELRKKLYNIKIDDYGYSYDVAFREALLVSINNMITEDRKNEKEMK